MLILTRRIGENLMIGDDVRVSVLGVKGNQVRIGIDAPKSVSVHREEIYYRIKHEESIRSAASEQFATAHLGKVTSAFDSNHEAFQAPLAKEQMVRGVAVAETNNNEQEAVI